MKFFASQTSIFHDNVHFFANLPIYSELLDLKTKNSLIVNIESNIAK